MPAGLDRASHRKHVESATFTSRRRVAAMEEKTPAMEEKTPRRSLTERTKEELEIAGFDEIDTPEADVVSLGSASYTKMLGKIYA